MPKPRPLTEADKKKIRAWNAEGVSRNEIGRRLGRAQSTVSMFCKREGLVFEGTLPAAMLKARALSVTERQVLARERRLTISELHDAKIIDAMQGRQKWVTRQKTQGGGEQFTELDWIPEDDFRNATSAEASNASAFRSYAPLEIETGIQEAKSMLDKVIESLEVPDE